MATISNISWTYYTEVSIISAADDNGNSLYNWYTANLEYLDELTKLITSGLDSIKHKSIVALIT